jgi:hypothetical protein
VVAALWQALAAVVEARLERLIIPAAIQTLLLAEQVEEVLAPVAMELQGFQARVALVGHQMGERVAIAFFPPDQESPEVERYRVVELLEICPASEAAEVVVMDKFA